MSADWEQKQLSDVVELIIDNRGRNPKSYVTAGIPVIDNFLITSDGEANLGNVKRFIDEETYNSFLRKHIKKDDVLMTLVGNGYGKVATTPRERCAIIQNTIGLRCNKDNNNLFLYYLLKNNRESLVNLNRGAAQPSIKVGDVLNLEFNFPPIEKQKRIADILGSLDDKIELNRQTNQTLEQIAQAIFKSWFVDLEPVKAKIKAKQNGQNPELAAMCAISGKTEEQLNALDAPALQQLKTTAALFPDALVESELGEIPEGWSTGTLDDLCDLNSKSWTKKNAPDEVWYVDLANAKNGVVESVQYYLWDDAPSRAKRVISEGDTIVGTVRPGNRSFSLIGATQNQLTASTGFAVLSPKKQEYLEFLYISATGDENIGRLAHLADGGAYPAVRPDVVTQMELTIPSEQIMDIFSGLVKHLFQKRNGNLIAQSNLESLRDTLLPKLLSGELVIEANQAELEVAV